MKSFNFEELGEIIESEGKNYQKDYTETELKKHLLNTCANYVFETYEYQKLEKLYSLFLEETAKLFNKILDQKTPLHIAIMYRELLFNGVFSENWEFNYHKYDMDHSFIYDILGARICSGTGISGHITKNFIDLIRMLGYDATILIADTLKPNNRYVKNENLLDKKPSKINDKYYLVAGIDSDKGKFILDLTNNKIANVSHDEKLYKDLNGECFYYVYPCWVNAKNIELEENALKTFQDLKSSTTDIITLEDYEKTKLEVLYMIKKYKQNIFDYQEKINLLLKEITSYEAILSQYSDEKSLKNDLKEMINILKTQKLRIKSINLISQLKDKDDKLEDLVFLVKNKELKDIKIRKK